MDETQRQHIMREAYEHWLAGRAYEAGKLIFESIPVADRHRWAAGILELAYPHFPSAPEVDALLEFAKNPDAWGRGPEGDYASAIRLVSAVNQGRLLIWVLAAQVGKIVYTSQGYRAPFDHSAGWRIAEVLKRVVQQVDMAEFEQQAWARLCDGRFIQLDEPVVCHPRCPVCWERGLITGAKDE